MDEEMEFMEDFVVDDSSSFSDDFFDPEYEFDAFQFYDFSRVETESEAREAETWFRYAREYPPSPFIVKLKLMKAAKVIPAKPHKSSSRKIEASRNTSTSSVSDADTDHGSPSRDGKIKGVKQHNLMRQDSVKAKPKSTVNLSKPSGSSFMKPTASHLAKQNKECEIHYGGCGRLQKPLVTAVEKLRSPTRCQNYATKRQKLEIGYLRKVAQLEGNSNSRSKTTIPRKPALVTEERAQRRRSQNKSESVQQPKANTPGFKARPLNRKILSSPKCPQRKKSMTPLTEFQEFHLKTTARAMQVQSANVGNQALYKQNSAPPVCEDIVIKSQNSGKKDKCKSPNNSKARTPDKVHQMKDGGLVLNAKHNSQLPIELFKKLSLKSESETKIISSLKPPRLSKALKENAPRPSQQEFRRCGGKPNQCGSDRRITEVKPQPNINRSVDIR
ncbi:uncharacterized protein LOC112508660 [Cynara cardunculus var. scolymus]|uniref:uncharacterized protein LOC112508660 n=1 Tax=Cynara cardunculus var. scolymus TaxID=59895 RepID=UPI000D62C1ED|nr:uncharacterized protein LOC112508660 [Cynara cardunculus var. scolymus]